MATTRIIPMHINKGKSAAQCLKARISYVLNPKKQRMGALFLPMPVRRKQLTRNFYSVETPI